MMMTGGALRLSASVNARPRRIRVPIVSKNAGDTALSHGDGSSGWTSRPAGTTRVPQVDQNGTVTAVAALSTPDVARKRTSISVKSLWVSPDEKPTPDRFIVAKSAP